MSEQPVEPTEVEETEVEMVEPEGDDPIDVTRGDAGYDDTEEGAVGDAGEIPQPSVYSAEEVGGVEETPGRDS